MPIAIIEVPAGLSLEKKKRLVRELNASLASAYSIEENYIFLHEHSPESIGIAGQLLAARHGDCDAAENQSTAE